MAEHVWIVCLLLLGVCSDGTSGQCGGLNGGNRDCGYGTGPQNWFGPYYLGLSTPFGFVSTMPIGYGSGAMPFYRGEVGGFRGTSLGPGGFLASSSLVQAQPEVSRRNIYF